MAKFKFKDLDKTMDRISKRFDEFTVDKKEMDKVAKVMKSELLINLRQLGRDANDVKLPTLRKSTIQKRKSIAKYNKTLKSFSPGKSNLTITGQLLRAINVEANLATVKGMARFAMEFIGMHKPYVSKKTKSLNQRRGELSSKRLRRNLAKRAKKASAGKPIPNSDIVKFIKNNQYNKWWSTVKFLGVTKRAEARIRKQFIRFIRRRRKK